MPRFKPTMANLILGAFGILLTLMMVAFLVTKLVPPSS